MIKIICKKEYNDQDHSGGAGYIEGRIYTLDTSKKEFNDRDNDTILWPIDHEKQWGIYKRAVKLYKEQYKII